MALSPGTRLGPYELSVQIGVGGMGEVYQATDTNLKREVAIKVLPEALASNPERLARFQREAEVLASLNHPNIAAIYGLERSGGQTALVMELVEGPTLEDRVGGGRLPLEEVLSIAGQVADALAAAHAQGIIHRDLKPANVKVRPDGTVKVLDFGLAKVVVDDDEATRTVAGTVQGTAAYMSPEQARGETADARSDVFSFGVVLYEVLSGRRPFGAASFLDTLNAVVHTHPVPLDSPAADLVMRCLAKEPAQRFQTMRDVRAALQRVASTQDTRALVQAPPSIAVLPFANMSRNEDDEYFSDGLAEEIINVLAQLPGLKVIARTSAFAFKGKNEDIRKIAETLGVTTVLEGSVRRAGTRLRVTAQLILATDGTHLWSHRYDREMADVFAMQDEIATAIAEALKVTLAPTAERRMPKVAAYEAYLQYRFHQWQLTPEAAVRSRACLEQALALDPDFALPHVGLADSYLAAAAVGALPAHEAMPEARTLARRALALDPDLPEAHAMLGIIAGHYEYDWDEAGRRFDLAVAREPLTPHMRLWHAWFYLLPVGRTGEAVAQMQRAIEDDPLGVWYYFQAFALHLHGRHDEALAACHRGAELNPELWIMWNGLGQLHAVGGQLDEAGHYAARAIAHAPWSGLAVGLTAGIQAATGRREEARTLLAGLPEDAYGGPVARALYWVLQGDAEAAVGWLLKAADQRFPQLPVFIVLPFASQLRGAPSWPALLAKLNLSGARRDLQT